jgi:hypothetical protein
MFNLTAESIYLIANVTKRGNVDDTRNTRSICALANRASVSTRSHQEAKCGDNHCFPCAGFTSDCGKPWAERQPRLSNNAEVFDDQFVDHELVDPCPRQP